MKNKFSKGEWFINYVSGIPIGVDTKIMQSDIGTYSMNIVELILQDTDEFWEKEEEETTANLKLISAAPDLLNALVELKKCVPDTPVASKALIIANKAIKKATE